MNIILSPTFLLSIGILLIAASIGLVFNHDLWYLFPIPLAIGMFVLYCDISMKRHVIQYINEQMKPINELRDSIIDEIEKHEYVPDDKTSKEEASK